MFFHKINFLRVLFVFLSLAFALPIFAVTANVTDLVFTTEERRVSVNTISEGITVQTQNSGGSTEKVDETNDVVFSSTSSTGEFLNSSGSPVSTTMAKNTSSRTFYYRDSAEGTYTLTITITGRDTGKSFNTSQSIVVGDGGDNAGAQGNSSNQLSSSSSNPSSHSAIEDLVSKKSDLILNVSAGRKRLVSINTPIEFDSGDTGKSLTSESHYSWSFGDGAYSRGKKAMHIYRFPGEYNVVLSVSDKGKNVVTRTEVKVIEPQIKISDVLVGRNGFVEIENQSFDEVNLGGFILPKSFPMKFIADNTIIKPKAKIRIPMEVPTGENLTLFYPNQETMLVYNDPSKEIVANQEKISEIQDQLLVLQSELVRMRSLALKEVVKDGKDKFILENEAIPVQINNQTANLIEAFDNHKENRSLFSKSMNFLKSLFDR